MTPSKRRFIAERALLVSSKGANEKRRITIRITEPWVVQPGEVTFPVDGAVAASSIVVDGLDEAESISYGVDSIQAVNLASNIESLIHRLSARYDFFWSTGEPYFDVPDDGSRKLPKK